MRTMFSVLALVTACGGPSESKEVAQPAPYSLAVADAAALPACDEEHQGQLVYVMDTKQFQTCQAGTWTAIAETAPGLAAAWECGKSADLDPSANSVHGLKAEITTMTNGTTFMSCMDVWIIGTNTDSSTWTEVVDGNTVAAQKQVYICEASFTTAQFDAAAKQLTWTATIEGGTSEAVSCMQVFPL